MLLHLLFPLSNNKKQKGNNKGGKKKEQNIGSSQSRINFY